MNLDLTGLKWTKNVNRQDRKDGWAYEIISNKYPHMDIDLKIFGLHWKTGQEKNAKKPQEGELIILRQRTKVTHIVKLLNNSLREISPNPGFECFRLVEVIWMVDNWDSPPEEKTVFDRKINFPPNGNIHKLINVEDFQERWGNDEEGLKKFQQHIQQTLHIEK